ncbi:YhdP family protein [Marinomonas transparens]|uniref:TIGR02099 family protein n=1 Tax=Marinomonas transparens TaxID=2795388 RepID=A0A934JKX6_9GAMM|nr:YhdP family protein [Marinomonas transparens]MBJ7537706.1 TIGR02099 family protein [Marinomonas transparens]
MSKMLRKLIIVCWWLAVFMSAALAIFVLSVKQLLPYLDHYRPQIESNLKQITGYSVTLENIEGSLEGIDPTVSVIGLNVQANDQPAVVIDELRVRFDVVQSLLTLSPQFTYIRFIHPVISLQETGGKWRLNGALASKNVTNDVGIERVLDYLSAQRNFSIVDAKLLIISEEMGNHSLTIPSTYIFRKGSESFLTSTLYLDDDKSPLEMNAKIVDPLSLFSGYHVKASIKAPVLSLPLGSSLVSAVPELASIQYGGDIWVDFKIGKELEVQFESTNVLVSFRDGESYQASPSIKLRYSQKSPSLHVDVHNLVLKDQLGHGYPASNLSYEWNALTNRSHIGFDRFDIALAHQIGKHFLLPDWNATKILTGLSPVGMAKNGSLRLWREEGVLSFQYLSNLVSGSVDGYKGIPKASNINAVFSLSEESGYIDFRGRDNEIEFDTVYDEAWKTDSLSGYVDWRRQENIFLVAGRDLVVDRNGSSITGGFRLEIRRSEPDWISLDLHGENVSIKDRLTYIPQQALNEQVVDWIDEAFVGGNVDSIDVLVHSELIKAPSPHVRVQMAVSDVDVAFDKKWPVARQVNGTFDLNQAGISVNVDSALWQGVPVSGLLVTVPIAAGSADWVNLKGALSGESSQIFSALQATPLAESVLLPFDTWQIEGSVDSRFEISVPLIDDVEPKVELALDFQNNALYVGDVDIHSQIHQGRVNYTTAEGITGSEFDLEAFGGDAHLVLSSTYSATDELVIAGDISGIADLYKVAKWRKMSEPLASRYSGDVGYSGQLWVNQVQSGQVDFTLSSDLQGGVIDFPLPIGKTAEESKKLTVKVSGHGQDLIVDQDYDAFMRSRVLVRDGEFIGGDVMLNNTLPLSSNIPKGLVINGGLDQLDVMEWQEVIKDLSELAVSAEGGSLLKAPQWLSRMDIIVDNLKVNEQNTLHNLKASYDAMTDSSLRVSSDEVSLVLTDREYGPDLHFNFLSWNTAQEDSLEKATNEAPIHANQIPNMTLSIDQFYLDDSPYGDWQLTVSRDGNRVRIDPITTQLKTGKLKGYIVWLDEEADSNVEFVVQASGDNLEELTKKFSTESVVTSKKYQINVALNWKGHPFYFDRESVSGHINFDSRNGNFSSIDEVPSFLKVLGIFNMGALTRRLTLDFSDVYASGLSYDEFDGALSLSDGILTTTSPIAIISPSAEIVVEGSANIVDETLDERMTATIPISGALPLAGLLWGTPQLAGLLYITNKLIGSQLSKVTSVRYKVEGTFDEPIMTPIKYQPKDEKGK